MRLGAGDSGPELLSPGPPAPHPSAQRQLRSRASPSPSLQHGLHGGAAPQPQGEIHAAHAAHANLGRGGSQGPPPEAEGGEAAGEGRRARATAAAEARGMSRVGEPQPSWSGTITGCDNGCKAMGLEFWVLRVLGG